MLDNKAIALAFCAPERFTDGTYNLYAIGIHASHQGKGIGQQIMIYLEQYLQKEGPRLLIVETSGDPTIAAVRTFYLKCGYHQEGIIADFWQKGEDKVIFSKHL